MFSAVSLRKILCFGDGTPFVLEEAEYRGLSSPSPAMFEPFTANMSLQSQNSENYPPKIVGGAVLLTLVFSVVLVFSFGLKILLAVVPVIALSCLAYVFHVRRLSQKTREISDASRIHLATVEALASAIDARDQIGLGHVRRTQIYAVGLGRLLGLPSCDIEALRTGALLHDIGKLAIPDYILNKPDRLTPAEFEKTKVNTVVGASILDKVGFDCPVVPTVKYHHERWDGKGYPDGLSGEAIPLTARVLAVSDAFDTLRCARPYRAALEREKARQIIQSEAGTRFDPYVVNTLLKNLTTLENEITAQGIGYASGLSAESEEDHHYAEQIKSANREVFNLYELAREFSSSLDLNEALDMFIKKLGVLVPFDTCALFLLDANKRTGTAARVAGLHATELVGRTINAGQGATGYVLKTNNIAHNVDPDLDFTYSQSELTGVYSTMLSLPLIADEELIGAVTLYSVELEEYLEDHVRLLETISRIAADAIRKTLKHDETKTHALTDPMTGLPNARSLQMQFDKELARASRGGTSFQLVMMDLDGFKAVNDNFGHKAGDELLREIGQVIKGQLRDYDFLARYGGDEFVALIPETSMNNVTELCDRIEKAVLAYRLKIDDNTTASVGVSIGASGYPAHAETFDKLVIAADKAMYYRKSNRKKLAARAQAGNAPLAIDDAIHATESPESLIVELDETHVITSAAIN